VLLAASLGSTEPAPLRLLFIGNSLTAANNLPALVAAIGKANGRDVTHARVVAPDTSLEDHWNQGDARRALTRGGGWDLVVLQQGPSALPESRALLVSYARRFAEEIRAAGARPALYMVWPSRARRGDFPGVSQSYSAAARAAEGVLFPVGDAWREAWRLDAGLPLYDADGFHPSLLGSRLAALVIYQVATGQSPAVLPFDGLTDAQTQTLRQAAAAVLAR
jgi:hypothetical protein